MNLWKSVVFLLMLAVGTAAHAQFSFYGEFSATRLTGIPCLDPQGICSGAGSNAEGATDNVGYGKNSHVNTSGGWGGVSYDFKDFGMFKLGVDVRAGEGHSNKSADSDAGGDNATSSQHFLGGVKATFHPVVHRMLKPYAQFSMGWARSNAVEEDFGQQQTPNTLTPVSPRQYDHFLQYEGFVGLDIKIVSFMDLRLPEVGLGTMQLMGNQVSTNPAYGSHPATNSAGVYQISGGIVFHLP